MAKCILMSIKPKYVSMILNKTKTIEVRKRFPIDYVGWVYIYCTKGKKKLIYSNVGEEDNKNFYVRYKEFFDNESDYLNSKVVARFWCDKVEDIKWHKDTAIDLDYYKVVNVIENEEILKASCLQLKELEDYLQIKNANNLPTTWGITFNLGKAIHITKLEIFDKPKELKEFHKVGYKKEQESLYSALQTMAGYCSFRNEFAELKAKYRLTRAPQSYCFIEV